MFRGLVTNKLVAYEKSMQFYCFNKTGRLHTLNSVDLLFYHSDTIFLTVCVCLCFSFNGFAFNSPSVELWDLKLQS